MHISIYNFQAVNSVSKFSLSSDTYLQKSADFSDSIVIADVPDSVPR